MCGRILPECNVCCPVSSHCNLPEEAKIDRTCRYAYTPESFPTAVRGTGTGVASGLNRVMGLGAPALAMSISNPTIPIYVSGALGFAAALAMVFLPIETRDKPAL